MGITNTFSAYFVKSILKLGLVGLLILLLNVGLFTLGIKYHFLLAANDPINRSGKIQNEVVNADTIDTVIIPSELDYAIFDKQTGEMVESNMNRRNQKKAGEFFQNTNENKTNHFIRYESQYETILIYYNLKVQFSNTELRKALPNPGVWLTVLSILTYCIYLGWNIRSFSQVIIQENRKLISIAGKIKAQDLNIEFPRVQFNEYKEVMGAMEDLSEALVKSIQKEIEITNAKAEQISYLVHDVKIPLTVIKGNVELLEAMTNEDMKESYTDIMNSVQQIERYIQQVIDINLNNKQVEMNQEEIVVNEFLCELETGVRSLGHHITLENLTKQDTKIFIDVSLFIRAINNIVFNAIERTPPHEKVQIIVKQDEDRIQFIIIDQGPGFSKEAIKKGTELFYTENDGRTNNSHYGLGLTFTEKVIKQHNGAMKLYNNVNHSGEVLVELPVITHVRKKKLLA